MYGVISFSFSYYGEMITYLGMTLPMAVFSLVTWLRNPYQGNKAEVEVSSVSNFESYQANRLKCRYRNAEKKTELCHTLNGSALALPRIVAAILENNQTPEGIRIPKVLVPYCGFDIID